MSLTGVCNYGTCLETDTRPSKDGPRCREHEPWKLAGREEPPSEKMQPRVYKRRSYASEWRQTREGKQKNR